MLYWVCDYLFVLGSKLIHVKKEVLDALTLNSARQSFAYKGIHILDEISLDVSDF